MENEAEKLQTDLKIAAAFLKAHEEVKAKQAEKKERMYKKAVIAADNRRKKREEESQYLETLKSTRYEPTESVKALLKKNCGIDLDNKTTKE